MSQNIIPKNMNKSVSTLFADIHYDPLMMSQKEAPMCASWVLPRKVAKMV